MPLERPGSGRWRAVLGVLFAAVVLLPGRASAQPVEHAFIFVIDGLRSDEGFDDPTLQYVGPLADELAPQGSLLTYLDVREQTFTLPTHQAMLTGNFGDFPNTWPDHTRVHFAPRTPTLFEAYRLATGAPETSCWVVANMPLAGHDMGFSSMPGYGEALTASRNYDGDNQASDSWVWEQVDGILDQHEVGVMLVNLNEVDRWGHEVDWDAYTGRTAEASDALVAFWDRLQADPVYQDSTVLLVTTDHGRHAGGVDDGWVSHGCSCLGCRKSFLLALGPGIRQGFSSDMACSSLDLAPTLAHLMELPFPYHRGRVLTEILDGGESIDPGPGGRFHPMLLGSAERIIRLSEWQDPERTDDDGAHRIVVEISGDGGSSWEPYSTSPGSEVQLSPVAWTDGETVVAGWLEVLAHGEAWNARLRRLGSGDDVWEEVLYEPMIGASTPVGNLALSADADGRLWLLENNALNERLRMWVSDDQGVSWSDVLHSTPYDRYFPRDARVVRSGDVLLLAYSAHAEERRWEVEYNDNTEIYWQLSEDGGETWDGEYGLTDDDAPSIQPAMAVGPDGRVRLVWSDRRSGVFQLYHASSTDDGVTFSPPAQLTFDGIGAWEPVLSVSGGRLHLAWSAFDERDSAAIHLAALDEDALVGERVVSQPGRVARTPALLPLGECSSLATWSESDLVGPWELAQERVETGETPVTWATGSLSPETTPAGGPAFILTISLELTLVAADLGVDLVEVALPDSFQAAAPAEVDVDGDPVDAAVEVDGTGVSVTLDDPVTHDGAQVTLRLEITPPDDPADPAPAALTLARQGHPCTSTVAGDLSLGADPNASDDDDDDTPGDDDTGGLPPADPGNCECSAGRPPLPAALAPATIALLSMVLVRRRRPR